MIVGKAIYYLLTNATDVTDIVSTRVYPEVAQQDADLPFIVYNVTNNEPSDTKPEPSKLDTAQVEVNIYSDSYTEAIDLAVAVRAALDRVKGTYNGVNVQSIQYQNEVIDFDEPQRAYNISADYDVRISRSGFEIAQGSPITGVQLGELSDVDVTGVTNGQLIAYNSTTGNWEAANDAGGANELSDLSDASVSLPSDGEVLIYSGGEFVNDNIAISNVTGLQAALDAAPDNLRELTDVTISGLADNDYLQYDSASGTWQNSTLILGRNGEQYTGNYDSEAETLRAGATATVELYYTAQADGDGLAESAESDTATAGYDIRRKLYYSEAAQADPDTGTWVQFADIADDTTFASAKATLLAYLKARTGGTVPISLKMTWEEVAEAPSFTGLLNESYGSGAAAAYSTRRLNGNVTECMVIRRASDSTTTTIGFDGSGNIDESAITTFCTGTTCTVVTWKDQSGNGNDATAAASGNEPTIYTGGALVKENGKVAVEFDGSDDYFAISANILTSESYLSESVAKLTSTTQEGVLWNYNTGTSNETVQLGFNRYLSNEVLYRDDYGTGERKSGITNNTRLLYSVEQNVLRLDGNAQTGSAVGRLLNANEIGGSLFPFLGNTQELLFWNGAKSAADRTSIESNIGDYFTQNTPLLDTYSGAAAAYSLRLLDSTYTGSAVEVYNGSSYADIGFNIFGELDTVALAAHCGSNDGFVRTWYDQAGSNDATQTTTANMPKIYDGTTGVVTEHGKPCAQFDGSNDYFQISTSISAANGFIAAFVSEISATGVGLFVRGANCVYGNQFIYNSSTGLTYANGRTSSCGYLAVNASGMKSIAVGLWDWSNDTLNVEFDGVAVTPNTNITETSTSIDRIRLGVDYSTNYSDCKIHECIIWPSNSLTIADISDDINTFYSIY